MRILSKEIMETNKIYEGNALENKSQNNNILCNYSEVRVSNLMSILQDVFLCKFPDNPEGCKLSCNILTSGLFYWNSSMIEKTCEVCGGLFNVSPCRRESAKYCSKKCWNKRNPPKPKICIICGKQFITYRSKQRCCCRRCSDVYNKKRPRKNNKIV